MWRSRASWWPWLRIQPLLSRRRSDRRRLRRLVRADDAQGDHPVFEAKHGVKVEYVAGNSTDTLAKLQAQKGNQQIDVAIVDDGPMYQAMSLGFCAPIQGLAAGDIYDSAKFKDNKAVGIGLVGTGIMYNTKVFKEKGWAAPTSWNDLKDPKFKKLLVIPPINNTYGLHTLSSTRA